MAHKRIVDYWREGEKRQRNRDVEPKERWFIKETGEELPLCPHGTLRLFCQKCQLKTTLIAIGIGIGLSVLVWSFAWVWVYFKF